MNRFIIVLSIIYLFFVNNLHGQSCDLSISGVISDLHDGSPIFGALVSIKGTNFFTQTDEKGRYFIEKICSGIINLQVKHPNCDDVERIVKFDKNKILNLKLEHHINELEEIVLIDFIQDQINNSVKESLLDVNQINFYSGESLTDALSSIPGVSGLKTGNAISKPIIHGMYGSRVGIVANGIRQNDQEWGLDHAPNIDLNSFESVQLIKGAAALKYGGDTAGGMIILSSNKKKLRDSLYGSSILNLESNGKGGTISSKLTKTSSKGHYFEGIITKRKYGDFRAPEYILSNTGIDETDFSLKLGKNKIISGWEAIYSRFANETGILRAAHIGNVQDLLYALSSEKPLRINPFTYEINSPKQKTKHQNLHFSYFKNLKDIGKWELKYNYQVNRRQEFDIRRGGRSVIPAIDILFKTHNLTTSFFWDSSLEWDFELGASALYQDNFSDPRTGVKRLIPDHLKHEIGSFLIGKYKPNNLFNWDLGLRINRILIDAQKYYKNSFWLKSGYSESFGEFERGIFGSQILTNPIFSYLNVSMHTGISYLINNEIESSFSYVLSQRAPNSSELFSDGLHHSLATIEYGDLSLNKETTHKVLLSFTKSKGSLTGSLEPFISKTSNFIFIEPSGLEQTIRGAFPVWEYDSTDVFMFGMDMNLKINFNNQFNFQTNASYIYAKDILSNTPIISIPPFNLLQRINYISLNKKWDILFSHNFVGRQNRFPNNNFSYGIIENGILESQLVDISSAPDHFHKLDFILSLHLEKLKGTHLRFFIKNITNSDYRDYLNRMRYYASEIGRNFQIQLIINY